jgi:hypothetical protein
MNNDSFNQETDMETKTITISIAMVGGLIRVDPDQAELSKGQKAQAKWQGDPPNLNFSVSFKERTPFTSGRDFGASHPDSGPLKDDVSEGERFRYSVKVGDTLLDPGIIITR